MRISDWSSDVCSSDLLTFRPIVEAPKRASRENAFPVTVDMNLVRARYLSNPDSSIDAEALDQLRTNPRDALQIRLSLAGAQVSPDGWQSAGADDEFRRSEEHTSELQSHMRIS